MPLVEKLRPVLARWTPGEPALIGLSGGVDSVVLLDILTRLGFTELVVCHLHHGLRGADSDADEALVRTLAAHHHCELEVRRVSVAALAEEAGESIETAGRNARRTFFAEVAKTRGLGRVFLAHHADDQAETVMMNLLRGSGLNGLGGMREVTSGGPHWHIVRPLLSVSRVEIFAHARARQLVWRADASNDAPSHFRNRLRLEAIPALSKAIGHDVKPALLQCARLAAEDDQWMAEQATLAASSLTGDRGELQVAPLRQTPLPLARRILRHWMRRQGVPNIGLGEVESALAVLAATGPPSSVNLPGGWRMRRRAGRLFFDRQSGAVADEEA